MGVGVALLTSASPTTAPIAPPTSSQSAVVPSLAPTAVPSVLPSATPTATPTTDPTAVPTAAPTAAPLAPTAAPTLTQCPAESIVPACADDPLCASCYSTLLTHQMPELPSIYQLRHNQLSFFDALMDNPECLQLPALYDAVSAVEQLHPRPGGCFDPCQLREYPCARNASCAACIEVLRSSQSGPVKLATPACIETGKTTLAELSAQCYYLPSCSLAKDMCTGPCVGCWDLLRRGEGAAAAMQCDTVATGGALIDNVAEDCVGGLAPPCDFWRQRCMALPACAQCLEATDFLLDTESILAGVRSGACDASLVNEDAARYIQNYIFLCPPSVVTPCSAAVVACVAEMPLQCIPCLVGTGAIPPEVCKTTLDQFQIKSVCTACPPEIAVINRVVMATVVVGATSLAACAVVITVIVAYSKDTHYFRERIILGLMIANMVYSGANVVQMDRISEGAIDCGKLYLPVSTVRIARSLWFFGKYSLGCFELVLLGVSISALRYGVQTLLWRHEVMLHALCVLCAAAAFTAFYIESGYIEAAGYNDASQDEAILATYNYLNADDDQDETNPGLVAGARFAAAQARYDRLLQTMLQAWLTILGLAIVLWAWMRVLFARIVAAWKRRLAENESQWDRDLWHESQQQERQVKFRVLTASREAYDEVARPLEPFVFIFVLFGIPAAVMATEYCHRNSVADATSTAHQRSNRHVIYGSCDVWCELALSFRSLATVVVYFSLRENRRQLTAVRTLWRRLIARLADIFRVRRAAKVTFDNGALERVRMLSVNGREEDDDEDVISKTPYHQFEDQDEGNLATNTAM